MNLADPPQPPRRKTGRCPSSGLLANTQGTTPSRTPHARGEAQLRGQGHRDSTHRRQDGSLAIAVAQRRLHLGAEATCGEPPVEWFLLTNLPLASSFIADWLRGRLLPWSLDDRRVLQGTQDRLPVRTTATRERAQLAQCAGGLSAGRVAPLTPTSPRTPRAKPPSNRCPDAGPARRAPRRRETTDTQTSDGQRRNARRAGLGGHLPPNADPGWLVLGRGMHDLLLLELGWRA